MLWELVFPFCTAPEMEALRQTCTYWHRVIPAEWTKDLLLVADESGKKTIPTQTFLEFQPNGRFLHTVIFSKTLARTLPLSSRLRQLHTVNVLNASQLEALELHSAHRLRELMLVNCIALRQLHLPPKTGNRLRMLYLSNLDLENFTIDPEWKELRNLSLCRIGKIQSLKIPETLQSLEFVHLTHNGLEYLDFNCALKHTHSKTLVYIQERHTVRVHCPLKETRRRVIVNSNAVVEWT